MKTTQIFLFALFGCVSARAQTNTFPSTGDVGIGTTTPSAKLHVVGQDAHFFSNAADNTLELGRDTNQKILIRAADTHLFFDWIQDADENNPHIMYFRNLAQGTSPSNDIRFQTSSTDRMTIKANGNIGIGTSAPGALLHINNGNDSYGAILANANESSFSLYTKTLGTQPVNIESFRIGLKYGLDENNGYISFYRGDGTGGGFLGLGTNGSERVRISKDGNVGIGTANPLANLQVMGGIGINTGVAGNLSSGGSLAIGDGDTGLKQQGDGILSIFTNNTERIRISNGQGNVGIGTTAPDEKLTVKGRIHAEEVKVDLSVPGPDYVFKKGYDLKSLEEVQEHIRAKGHLPNIPSAQEMEKNGVELGLMNMKLLEKIEELTLYTIEQQKRIQHLEKENETLKSITIRVANIEALLKTE